MCSKTHILNCIAQQPDLNIQPEVGHEAYKTVELMLHARFAEAAWLAALHAERVGELELPLHLSKDIWRTDLSFEFAGMPLSLQDGEDMAIAITGMLSLQKLSLNMCNTGIESIAPLLSCLVQLPQLCTISLQLNEVHNMKSPDGTPWGFANLELLWSLASLTSLTMDLGNTIPLGKVDLLGQVFIHST